MGGRSMSTGSTIGLGLIAGTMSIMIMVAFSNTLVCC